MTSERAQTAVLGVVLLVGVVAISSVGILMLAAETTEELEQQAENERIEQSFVELSQTMSTTSATGDTTEVVDFAAGEHGAVVKTETGSINITGEDLDEPINVTIGAIEYEGDDGTRIAYQAGGVFRETGTETRIVSAPPIHYDMTEGVQDDTFNFPIVEVSDEEQLDSGEVTISHDNTTRRGDVPILEESTVEVNVTSEYCVGWENYFRHQTREGGDAIDEPCDEGTEGSVIAELGDLEREFEVEDGVIVFDEDYIDQHDPGEGTDGLFGDEFTDGQPPVLDDYIDEIVSDASDEYTNISDYDDDDLKNLDDDTYYIDEIDGDSLSFNLTDDDAVLAVDGDINIDGNNDFINISEGSNDLKVYSNGSSFKLNGNVYHDEKDGEGAKHIQIFGTSKMDADFGPGNPGYFEGLLYIASDEEQTEEWDVDDGECENEDVDQHQVLFQASEDFDGAIVAHSACAHAQASEFEFNEELEGIEIDLLPKGYKLPPNVYYLNIVEHKVNIEG